MENSTSAVNNRRSTRQTMVKPFSAMVSAVLGILLAGYVGNRVHRICHEPDACLSTKRHIRKKKVSSTENCDDTAKESPTPPAHSNKDMDGGSDTAPGERRNDEEWDADQGLSPTIVYADAKHDPETSDKSNASFMARPNLIETTEVASIAADGSKVTTKSALSVSKDEAKLGDASDLIEEEAKDNLAWDMVQNGDDSPLPDDLNMIDQKGRNSYDSNDEDLPQDAGLGTEATIFSEEENSIFIYEQPHIQPSSTLEQLAAQFESLCGEDPRNKSGAPQETLTLEKLEARYRSLCGTDSLNEIFGERSTPPKLKLDESAKVENPGQEAVSPLNAAEETVVVSASKDGQSWGCSQRDAKSSDKGNFILDGGSEKDNLVLDGGSKSQFGPSRVVADLLADGLPLTPKEMPPSNRIKELRNISKEMNACPADIDVQLRGCSELISMIHLLDSKTILASGIVEAIVAAMGRHNDSSEIQSMGCRALNTLVGRCSKKRREILKELGAKRAIDAAIVNMKKANALHK